MMARLRHGSVELEYRVDGPADSHAVVLSTGFGDQLTFWPETLIDALLAAGYRVVRFDTRDAGLSSESCEYDLDDLAQDLLAVISATTEGRAHVLGYSMGGQIALRAALASRAAMASMAFVFTSSGAAHLGKPRPAAVMASLGVGRRMRMEQAVTARLELVKVTSGIGYPYVEAEARAAVQADLDRAYRPEGAGRHLRALLTSAPVHGRLGDIGVPTTVVHASDDCFFGLDHGRDLAERLATSLDIIDGAGHNLSEAVGREVAARIIPFFTKHGAARHA